MPDSVAGPLSDVARAERRVRRAWAMPGSGHDRMIAIARVALPAGVGVLVAVMALAPVTSGHDISFVLAKNRVAVAKERMRVTQALYRGEDQKGQPFALTAQSAVQQTSTDPVVRLDGLSARIRLPQGPAVLVAPRGTYNLNNEKVGLDGPVTFRSADGYALDTHDVDLDMQTKMLASRSPVTGKMPLGTFSANRMNADLGKRIVVLNGDARLHIARRSGTSRR